MHPPEEEWLREDQCVKELYEMEGNSTLRAGSKQENKTKGEAPV